MQLETGFQDACSTRRRSRSNLARPYVERLIELQTVDMTFDGTIAPGLFESSEESGLVMAQMFGEVSESV